MADDVPGPLRRNSSFSVQDQPQSSRRRRNDSLQQFSENARHVPPHGRDPAHVVAEPAELGLDETRPGYQPVYFPGVSSTTPAERGYNTQHVYYPPIPVPYSRIQAAEATTSYAAPWLGRERHGRRPTADSYLSDIDQPIAPTRLERGRVRFMEPENRRRHSYSQSRPLHAYTSDESMSDPDSDPDIIIHRPYSSKASSYHSRSRSKSVRPRIYQSSDASDSDDDDDESGFDELMGGKVFQFVLSRTTRSLSKSGQSIDTDFSLEGSDNGTTSAKDDPNIPKNDNIIHVFQSRYTGDAVSDGTHKAELTVIHDPKKKRQPLFRWMHLKQDMMNLDELSTELSRIPAITDSERNGFAKLLAEVKRTCVKVRPTSKGNNVRHMDPRPIRITIPPDGRTKVQTSRFLTWLCVPYFSLEKYSGLLSASTASAFPIETLLQSEYARTTRERDMQQAVCKNGEVPEDHCFHIAQLWCIVLDNSLLVTCGRMSSSSLRADIISIVKEPPKEPAGKGKRIYVSYYDTVLWDLSLDSCLTWFDFLIHFREFWPQAVRVYHHGHVVTEKDWPRIVNIVKKVNTKVILDLRLWCFPFRATQRNLANRRARFHPQPPAVGVLRPLKEGVGVPGQTSSDTAQSSDQSTKPNSTSSIDNDFHVFSWLELSETEIYTGKTDVKTLIAHLQEVEDYLTGSTAMRDRNAYRDCNISSQYSVHTYLKGKGLRMGKADEGSRGRREYECRVDIYNAADIISSFFVPQSLDEETPTIGKFWGAIQSLVEMPNTSADDDARSQGTRSSQWGTSTNYNMHVVRSALRGFTRGIQSFQDILSHAPPPIRTKVEVPDSLVRAWLHLVIGLIQASQNEEAWNENINVAEALMRRGMNDIMDELPTEDLLSSSVIQPLELVALISLKLLQDTTGMPTSINDTYSDYLKGLENEITTNNSDRSHQFRITLFKQEVGVIRRVIASQLNVVDGMTAPQKPGWADQSRREREMLDREREKSKTDAVKVRSRFHERQGATYVDRFETYETHNQKSVSGWPDRQFIPALRPDTFSKLASTDPGGFRELLGRECRAWLERRDSEFLELDVEASRLEMMNANKIEITKDRQEAAVYAFTMVTIIFLPLSTISSIFGMNSSDVRDMDLGQWAYWAAALPTTIAVIVTGLWWMGELHNFVNWLRGLPSRTNRGYARVSRPPANGVIYYPRADYPGIDPQQAMGPYSRATLGPPVPRTSSWRY